MTITEPNTGAPAPASAATPGGRIPLNAKAGSAAFLLSLAGLILANLAPMIMAALGTLGFDIIAQGNILTAALLLSALVGIATSRLATTYRRRTLALSGMSLATVAFAIATFSTNPGIVVAAFLIGSAAIGAAISTSGAAIAAFINPNRVTATGGVVNRLIVMVALALIPVFGVGPVSVFGAVTILLAIGTVAAVWTPNPPPVVAQQPQSTENSDTPQPTSGGSAPTRRTVTLAGWALLIAFPIWGAGEDAVWALASALAANVGLSEAALGLALSVAAGCGIIAMLIVIAFGHRIGRAIPLIVLILLGGILKIAIGMTTDPGVLATLIIITNLLYAFAFVLVTATAAGLDVRGTWAGPLVAAYLLGSSFSPILGAVLVEQFGIASFGIWMGVISFVTVLPIAWAAHISTRVERAAATAGNPADSIAAKNGAHA